jgi:hypothetical protein
MFFDKLWDRLEAQGWELVMLSKCSHGHLEQILDNRKYPGCYITNNCMGCPERFSGQLKTEIQEILYIDTGPYNIWEE